MTLVMSLISTLQAGNHFQRNSPDQVDDVNNQPSENRSVWF